jgi:4-hydroxybenzoate polyprenyltransferase
MQGAVYCHVDVPMTKRNYIIMALMPGLLTGLVPWLAGIATGSLLWMLIGAIMIGGAVGDIMIVRAIREETPDTMIYDHPSLVGCYVYRKIENQ